MSAAKITSVLLTMSLEQKVRLLVLKRQLFCLRWQNFVIIITPIECYTHKNVQACSAVHYQHQHDNKTLKV